MSHNFEMVTFKGAEQAHCVLWFEETKSETQVLGNFCMQHTKEPSSRWTIYTWHMYFVENWLFLSVI